MNKQENRYTNQDKEYNKFRFTQTMALPKNLRNSHYLKTKHKKAIYYNRMDDSDIVNILFPLRINTPHSDTAISNNNTKTQTQLQQPVALGGDQ